MDNVYEEYRGFVIICPSKRILGTIFPVQATVIANPDRQELKKLLGKQSGDVVNGNSPQDAIDNAKRHIDKLLETEEPSEYTPRRY
jgi:hypothetical protein